MFEKVSPESVGISSRHVEKFIKTLEKRKNNPIKKDRHKTCLLQIILYRF